MNQLVLARRGVLEWQETPEPVIRGENEAIVRPLAVARCDLDIPIVQGHTLFRPPFPIGHEFVGEIVTTSGDVSKNFPAGQRVAVAFQVACGSCPTCKNGHSRSCESIPGFHDFGMGPLGKNFGGALTDLVHIPYANHMLLKLSAATDLVSVASLSDNIIEAWKLAGFHLESNKETPVLILGGNASSIGLYTTGLAVAMGAPDVLYLDSDPDRLKIASAFGAKVEQLSEIPRAWQKKYPLTVDANGTEEGYRFCCRSTAVDGICTSASIFWTNDFKIPYMDIYNSGITLKIGRVDSKEMMPRVLALIESGKFDAGKVVSRVADWQDAREAWVEPSTKLVVRR